MPGEYVNEMKQWAAELARKNATGDFVGFNHAVDLISKNFAVQPHEVAIFGVTDDARFLRFLIPAKLQEVGRIPLTSTNSQAAPTAREKRAEIINHFSVVPHASVFEAVPLAEEERGVPIQKIMSAPIILEKKMIGVIQVSRKARIAAEAGPDFTHSELRELKTIAEALGPCLSLGVSV